MDGLRTMRLMIHRRLRTCLGWLGIVLVLAPLLAPGVSHALRHADAQRNAAMHALWADLCSAVSASNAGDPAEAPPASSEPGAACGYCLYPAGHLAAPVTATPDAWLAAAVTPQPLRVDPDRPSATPARQHQPRAPPTPL